MRSSLTIVAAAVWALAISAPIRAAEVEYDFLIERQALDRALQEFAKQSGVQVIFFSKVTDGRQSPSLKGRYTAAAALTGLLSGSGLTYRELDAKTVEIEVQPKPASQTTSNDRARAPASLPVRSMKLSRSEATGSQASATKQGRQQQHEAVEPGSMSEVIVLGSRRTDRTVAQIAVPIDVLQPRMLERTGYTDMNDALRSLVPSFNAQRLPLNDGSSFVRPITLRGSPADHVLLLINGKRRHRSAVVQIGTGHATTSGSQGQDFNAIPPIAFERIEVLRDGAAAQYGSDAIAGVINMELRNDASGGALATQVGQYFAGDGASIDIQGNIGLPLTANGFLNVSGQYTHQDKTYRGGPVAGAEELRAMGVAGVPEHPLELGDPYYEARKLVWNAGLDFSNTLRGYVFGNYLTSSSTIGFAYRQPLPAAGFPANASYANSIYEGTPAHPASFDLRSIYPGGYVPQFSGDQTDFSTVIGLRGNHGKRFTFDIGARLGVNEIDYEIANTVNPSLGVRSPTRFEPGSLSQGETEGFIETSYDLSDAVLLFGGVSYRREAYEIGAGDPDSYAVGPLRDLPVGANGFQGFSPDIAGRFTTDSYAAFIELDADFSERWSTSVAVRYEDYAAFGDNFSYKLATRFALTNVFALRGAVSTGFRAPAAGQLFGTSQTSQLNPVTNDFILDVVLRPSSPEGRIFGSSPLVPETAFNLSAGLVIDTGNGLATTIDFYQIDVDDRLVLTPAIPTTAEQRAQLAALGFPNGSSVQQVRYFRNRLDTRVRGFDVVGTYSKRWDAARATDVTVAVNYNEQVLRGDASPIYDPGQQVEFEEGLPSWRGNLTVTHHLGDFDLMARTVYYGEWKRRDGISFRPRSDTMLLDAEISYRGFDTFDVSIGARNLLNKLPPDRGPLLRRLGTVHDNHSPYGVSGGYYYIGTRFNF